MYYDTVGEVFIQRSISRGVIDNDDRIGTPGLTLQAPERLFDNSSVVKGNDEGQNAHRWPIAWCNVAVKEAPRSRSSYRHAMPAKGAAAMPPPVSEARRWANAIRWHADAARGGGHR
jgi:hypothetical protein